MTEIKLGEQCEHGTLKRQCLVCELQAENERLRGRLPANGSPISDVVEDRDTYKARAEFLESAFKEAREECAGCRERCSNTIDAITASRDHWRGIVERVGNIIDERPRRMLPSIQKEIRAILATAPEGGEDGG